MNRIDFKNITIEEWELTAKQAGTRTSSRFCRPASGQKTYEYSCTFDDFISEKTYPVRYTDAEVKELVNYKEPNAKPIRIKKFVREKNLLIVFLDVGFMHVLPLVS